MKQLNNDYRTYQELVEEILECKKCRLWSGRKNAVPGEGPLNAKIMLIGEAPGRMEDLEGRPFVGAAGKLLTKLLSDIGLSREEVYITNLIKCRPPQNRDPLPDEIEACSPYLDRQIRLLMPKIIVTLGRHSTKYILSKCGMRVSSIGQVRGKVFLMKLNNSLIKVIPTYHPAVALYNPKMKIFLEEDFRRIIKKEIDNLSKSKAVTIEDFF